MAIKKFGDYAQTKAYTDSEQLPRGGYVCKIINAKVIENQYGQSIKVAFDIEEGEHKGYFKNKFDSNTNEDKKWPGIYLLNVPNDDGSEKDGWTKRKFRTFTDALEESNSGYHFDWDEQKFKGKLIGLVFNYREYEFNGRTGMTPNPARATSAKKIRDGKFKVPADKILSGSSRSASGSSSSGDFMNIPNTTEDEIPF